MQTQCGLYNVSQYSDASCTSLQEYPTPNPVNVPLNLLPAYQARRRPGPSRETYPKAIPAAFADCCVFCRALQEALHLPSPNTCDSSCTKVTPDPGIIYDTAGISAVPSFVKCAKVPRLNVSAATRVNYWLNQYDTSGQSKCTGSPAAAKPLAPGASLHAGNGLWRSTACSGTSCAVSFCVGETQCAAGQSLRV